MRASLNDASRAMNGQLLGEDREFQGVSIDSRTLEEDDLFFAIEGPNFDGHDFLSDAKAKGAAAAVVTHACEAPIRQIVVEDTRAALGKLGSAWRDAHDAETVGITGSNGKTTLKEMIAACLRRAGETLSTAGNLNNDLGVPLMLMRLTGKHRYAVFEMGANHIGEIAYLTSLVRPDIVVLTNAGTAHLEGFGSVDGIAEGKGEILKGRPRPRCAVLNADDHYFDYWRGLVADIDSLSFGLDESADVHASDIVLDAAGSRFTLHFGGDSIAIDLPVAGRHNVRNACAAAAVVLRLGLGLEDIAKGLASTAAVDGRLKAVTGPNGCRLFDDSYNSNPTAVEAAAEFLGSLDGRSILVLGDMLELGKEAEAMHKKLGERIAAAGVDRVYACGPLSKHTARGFGDGAEWFKSVESLVAKLKPALTADCNVLVKGSRSARMERVVSALMAGEAA